MLSNYKKSRSDLNLLFKQVYKGSVYVHCKITYLILKADL